MACRRIVEPEKVPGSPKPDNRETVLNPREKVAVQGCLIIINRR